MRYKHNVVDLDYNGFTFYGAVLRTDDYNPDLRGLMQFKHMSTQAFLRRFIRLYGEINTVLVFTALLITLVVAIVVTMTWIQQGTVDTAGLSGPILLTALLGGVVS